MSGIHMVSDLLRHSTVVPLSNSKACVVAHWSLLPWAFWIPCAISHTTFFGFAVGQYISHCAHYRRSKQNLRMPRLHRLLLRDSCLWYLYSTMLLVLVVVVWVYGGVSCLVPARVMS